MTTTITIEGTSCEHCEQAAEEALGGVDGVRDATADRDGSRASVDGEADVAELVRGVEDAGYTAHA